MHSELGTSQAVLYRSDIDGLRALAVASVIIFHLNRDWLPGGFVGVDIFFVISGYVVTHSLAQSTDGTLLDRLSAFYARRVKRLLPALLLCSFLTAIAYSVFFPPYPFEVSNASYRTGIAGLVGLSNFYLIHQNNQYFDGNGASSPFLHTWSLGVEEQFYLCFPLLLLVRFSRGRNADLYRLAIVLGFCAWSLWLSAAWSQRRPDLAYFAMPSRFWELGAGAAAALAERLGFFDSLSKRRMFAAYLQFAALLLLVFATIYTPKNGFPFPWAIPSVLGCVLLIIAGIHSNSVLHSTISSPSFVYAGKISYSLYLWHWPVIFVLDHLLGPSGALSTVLALITTCALACASYHWVEKPIRNSSGLPPVKVLGFAIVAVLTGAVGIELLRQARASLAAGSEQDWLTDWNAKADTPYFSEKLTMRDCHLVVDNWPSLDGPCTLESEQRETPTLFAVGDSHSQANWTMYTTGVASNRYRLYAISKNACALQITRETNLNACSDYWQHVRQVIERHAQSGDFVVLSLKLRFYSGSSDGSMRLKLGMQEFAQTLARRGVKLVVQAPLPKLDDSATVCVPTWYMRARTSCLTPKLRDLQARALALSLTRELARSEPNVLIWDPYELLCPESTCSHFQAGRPLFRDNHHLSLYGGRFLGPHFLAYLEAHKLLEPQALP